MTITVTQSNYLADVAERTGASFHRLTAAWSYTRADAPDADRAMQLSSWASRNGSFWQELDRHPDYRLAASCWRSRNSGQGDTPPRSVRFIQCSLAPTDLGPDRDFLRATWDPAGVMLMTTPVDLLLEHDTTTVLGTVDALIREGTDVHTLVTLGRGVTQDDVLAGVILGGEDVAISWAVSGLETDWPHPDMAHNRSSVVFHVGITNLPRVGNTVPPMLVRPTQRDTLMARANPRYCFDTGEVIRPASRARAPQVDRYVLPPSQQLTEDERALRTAMAEVMQRGGTVRVTGSDRVMRTAFTGTGLRTR